MRIFISGLVGIVYLLLGLLLKEWKVLIQPEAWSTYGWLSGCFFVLTGNMYDFFQKERNNK